MCLFAPFWMTAQLIAGWQSFYIDGREYEVTTPNNYNPNAEYPIIFELHSFGESNRELHNQETVNAEQYISVRPEGKDVRVRILRIEIFRGRIWNTWNEVRHLTDEDDVAHITNVYNDIRTKIGARFNPEKVYVFGYSNGGAMAMKMIEETNLFKAAAIRSMSFTNGHNIPSGASKIPIIFVHGTDDEIIPYNGGSGYFGRRLFSLSPNFEPVKTTVQKWANHYGLSHPLEIKYLKDETGTTLARNDFYYREYSHNTHPIYFFAIDKGVHATKDQFWKEYIKRNLLRMARSPKQFGVYREWR